MSTCVLQALQLSHFFGSRLIFKGVSCQIMAGQITLVGGPNGAGKSTLLKIMAGLLAPSSGTIERKVPNAAMAFMGHQTFVYPALSALANLEFWNSVYEQGQSEAELLALLDRVGLKPFALESAGTFSRGMAQRLSLARVLLVEPALIFLDEPATGLDTASQRLLHTELDAAKVRGAAIVWISHDLEKDALQADQMLILSGRRMSFCGSVPDWRSTCQA
ncbi:MAG: ABC transporter ATP-binding protein [Desulfovibrionales bacterium]|nr:ABC transporter ATP-binding protein [Desulfovibrionales bacterium]